MGLSHLELTHLLGELRSLEGAILQEVYQPSPTELVLELRQGRENRLLLFSVANGLARMHEVARRPANPMKPFLFQMLCRKELAGRLERIHQRPGERVVRLEFLAKPPPASPPDAVEALEPVPEPRARILECELLDRHGNLLLLDASEKLLGTLLPSSAPGRPLKVGESCPPLPPPPPGLQARDRFALRPEGQSYGEAVAAFFAAEALRLRVDTLKSQLQVGLRREIKRLERRIDDLEGDLGKAETAEQHRRYGDLLQIYLRAIPRGASTVTVDNVFLEDAPPIEIPLEPQLDAIGNVQRHYKLYRKYDSSIPRVLERLEEAEKEAQRLRQLLVWVDAAEGLERLQALEKEAHLPHRAKQLKPTAKAPERLPYQRYQTARGTEIWVGRSAKDNDLLTFRTARGNDFWLHVRGRPGAHVVIPVRPHPPDLETLLDAACLTLRHSGLPLDEKGEVAVTRVKYVRRVPGQNPGLVTFTQDKTIASEVSPSRLSTLTRLEGDEG